MTPADADALVPVDSSDDVLTCSSLGAEKFEKLLNKQFNGSRTALKVVSQSFRTYQCIRTNSRIINALYVKTTTTCLVSGGTRCSKVTGTHSWFSSTPLTQTRSPSRHRHRLLLCTFRDMSTLTDTPDRLPRLHLHLTSAPTFGIQASVYCFTVRVWCQQSRYVAVHTYVSLVL